MSAKVIWLFVFVVLYWAYCIFWGIKCARMAKTAGDYFITGRQLSMWVFVLAATSFSGWTFMGHPGLVYRDGFQYAYASFYTITIPFTGVLFLKRQWMLGKRFGYVTPGEMFADYFQGDAIRILTVMVALLFSIPYLGVQLGASGFLFNVLTDDLISNNVGMWVLSAVVLIYVGSGGLRAVAFVDTLQCILLGLGIIITGIIRAEPGRWLGSAERRLRQARGVRRWQVGNHPSRPQRLFRDTRCDPIHRRPRQGNAGGRFVDRRHVSDLHVRVNGHPVGTGIFHVDVRQPQPEAVRHAAGVGVVVRHRA